MVRKIRIAQFVLLGVGLFVALAPTLSFFAVEMSPALSIIGGLVPLVGFVAMALLYALFAHRVAQSADALHPEGTNGRNYGAFALLTAVPLVGSIIEIILLRNLAERTWALDPQESKRDVVMWLAIARLVLGFVGGVMMSVVFGVFGLYGLGAMAIGPLISFAMLAFITQLVVAPLIDAQPNRAVDLAASGAASPVAVASSKAPR